MKRKKSGKVGIQILILFLLLTICPAAARADSPLNITMTPQAMGDGRWDVTVEAENLRGIAMMQFALEYEAGGLQCLGYDKGSVFDGNLDPLVNTGSEGMIYFSWDSLNSLSADGTVMTLHFMSTEGTETALHFDSSRPTVFAYSNYSSPDVSLSGCIIGAPSVQPGDAGADQEASDTSVPTAPAQTEAPANYPATARAWADLHTTNILKITAANSTGIALFQNILKAFGAASKKYSAEGKFFAMNEKTHMKLVAEALSFNATGAIVAGMNNTMPAIGGEIVELDFIPDDNIIAGYGELYLLVERSGVSLANSEHFLFTSDKTVFKGTARYDGKPVIAEGFVVIGVNNVTPATTATFAQDTANT